MFRKRKKVHPFFFKSDWTVEALESYLFFFFYKNAVFPAQAEYSAYDISVLEFIGVSITSVWYVDLYRVTLCTGSIAFRCGQRGQDVTSNDTWPFWVLVRSEKGIILYG